MIIKKSKSSNIFNNFLRKKTLHLPQVLRERFTKELDQKQQIEEKHSE